eukprot:jgi/Psemu1/217224/e_gw1.841.28.1
MLPTPQQPRRNLPEQVIVGYSTRCSDQVLEAVRDGVNVVIWAFMDMTVEFGNEADSVSGSCDSDSDSDSSDKDNDDGQPSCVTTHPPAAKIRPRIDPLCAKRLIQQLDAEGYNDTVHLVSFGGWNGAHLPDDDDLSPETMYDAWKELAGDIFHGIDWDLEGHDRLNAPENTFSVRCLNAVGRISELAKRDGGWHADFHYFGRNVYAYWLSKYGEWIDFVSVQFYESYSRAGLEVIHNGVAPDAYLNDYVRDLVVRREESIFVDFGQDPSLGYPSKRVPFPRSKLVLGFANGWGASSNEEDDKVCYFDPQSIGAAYEALAESDLAPRGFMFWVIDEEGTRDIHFARALNDILKIRRTKPQNDVPLLETEGKAKPKAVSTAVIRSIPSTRGMRWCVLLC